MIELTNQVKRCSIKVTNQVIELTILLNSGYRDVLLNLRIKGIGCDMIMELQLHLRDVIKLVRGSVSISISWLWVSPLTASSHLALAERSRAPHLRLLKDAGMGE